VTTDIRCPRERVWEALTIPEQVREWDGAVPLAIPEGYPAPGQLALWRTRVGALPVVLRDRIETVEAGTRLRSSIDVGLLHLREDYALEVVGELTRLVSDNEVSSRLPGFGWLASRVARATVEHSMGNLKDFCERA
jgi:Polyketide cyclase / dehydrase and lipid transport